MTLWAINRAAYGRRENYAIKIIQIKEGFCGCESGFTMYEFFKMDDRVLKAAEEAEQKAAPYLAKISETQRYNQEKMQAAFMQAGVSESHFVATTGYGYGDRGRDVLDEVYARALGAEDALCRYNFVSGTHTLTVALFGVLRPGDTMLSVTGMPYDTLRGVIGITGDGNGSLKEFGINYEQLDLLPDGTFDFDSIRAAIGPAISRCCFETGPEVPEAVRALLGSDAEGLCPPEEGVEGKFLVDLKETNRRRLLQLGLAPEHIDVSPDCTMCMQDVYWSHRATKGRRGTMASVIML